MGNLTALKTNLTGNPRRTSADRGPAGQVGEEARSRLCTHALRQVFSETHRFSLPFPSQDFSLFVLLPLLLDLLFHDLPCLLPVLPLLTVCRSRS